ncbi:ribosome small subunit-dependent GTPase A [Haloferula sp. A504]|uniref:ribosome small subunit-dependent GTPase A n=1 Tax=Haloferula sp. A504 TaxID=3373601 RepID=UPI0031C9E648|nr:ribosome small subunit-dependent GTPase A [Verrucomicrobiaceae bacterium E54]
MLADLGWNDDLARAFEALAKQGYVPARLNRETTINYGAFIVDEDGEITDIDVVLSGKVWHDAETDAELPAVGDWAAVELGGENEDHVIRARLPRRSCFSRKLPGKSVEEQVIGANVDVVAVVTDPGADHNPRRMERYFALIGRSGARPVVLINKADAFPPGHCEDACAEIQALNPEAEVHLVSALEGSGLGILKRHLTRGNTMCIVGSSGVGKSTLVNQLMGEEWQWTSEVNQVTGKGRHTTTARELVLLPAGGMLIDNPGMREIQMWTDERTLRENFADLERIASRCQFHDCKHGTDKGCAIRAAVEDGELEIERLESFLRLDDEIEQLRRRAKKRQINIERRAKRAHRIKARNLQDRIDHEREQRGEWR